VKFTDGANELNTQSPDLHGKIRVAFHARTSNFRHDMDVRQWFTLNNHDDVNMYNMPDHKQ